MLQKSISTTSRSCLAAILTCFVAGGIVTAGEVDPSQGKWHSKYKTQQNIPQPEEMLLNTDAEPDLSPERLDTERWNVQF